jgi:hypothetical protein
MPVKNRSDRVKEVSTFTGTGTIVLLGAYTAFKTFSDVCVDGDTFDYGITHEGNVNWETGVGTYSTSTNSIERTTVTASSNNNGLVDFSEGYKAVYITVSGASFNAVDQAATKVQSLGMAIAFGF